MRCNSRKGRVYWSTGKEKKARIVHVQEGIALQGRGVCPNIYVKFHGAAAWNVEDVEDVEDNSDAAWPRSKNTMSKES